MADYLQKVLASLMYIKETLQAIIEQRMGSLEFNR